MIESVQGGLVGPLEHAFPDCVEIVVRKPISRLFERDQFSMELTDHSACTGIDSAPFSLVNIQGMCARLGRLALADEVGAQNCAYRPDGLNPTREACPVCRPKIKTCPAGKYRREPVASEEQHYSHGQNSDYGDEIPKNSFMSVSSEWRTADHTAVGGEGMTAPLISSQRYLEPNKVLCKATRFRVFIVRTAEVELRGRRYRILLDGHNNLVAAKMRGVAAIWRAPSNRTLTAMRELGDEAFARVRRPAKPCRGADPISPAAAMDIARLASLRMWEAYARLEKGEVT